MAYTQGQIALSINSPVISGENTYWLTDAKLKAHDLIYFELAQKAHLLSVAEVHSDTSITVQHIDGKAFSPEKNDSNVEYGVIQNFTNTLNARLASDLQKIQGKWHKREREMTGWFSASEPSYSITSITGEQKHIPTPSGIEALHQTLTGSIIDKLTQLESMVTQIQSASEYANRAEASAVAAGSNQLLAKSSETNSANSAAESALSSAAAQASKEAAASSASSAAASKSAAKSSETKAANSDSAAAASKAAAKASESSAAASASSSASSKVAAKSSETKAETSADSAAASQVAAKGSETKAAISVAEAAASEANAKSSETAALSSANEAASSELAAKSSESAAARSTSNAATSKAAAQVSETNAASSASSAEGSAAAAKSSETKAKASEHSAASSKAAAKSSETNAASSATAAAASESKAKASETASASSASDAASSESVAKASETAASSSAGSALASEEAAKVSEAAASEAATAAASSASKARISETASAHSAAEAARSETAAKTSQAAAASSKSKSAASESAAKASENAAAESENAAAASQIATKSSETSALSSASTAAESKVAAKSSETKAASSASAAAASQTAAKSSETKAASSASAAAASKHAAKISETNSAASAANASASKAAVAQSASDAAESQLLAKGSEDAAKLSEGQAAGAVLQAQSLRDEVAEIAGGTAPDSQRLEGKTKAQVVAEARTGLQSADEKLSRFGRSLIDTNGGQDLTIRGKRAFVGTVNELMINYGKDWSNVNTDGTWRFTGNIERNSHNSGYFVGSYNNVGDNSSKTNPIYTIGSNYQPSETDLNNMYGIGYTHANASFVPHGTGWGMYVAADGDARIFLDASHGRVHTSGDIYEAGTKLSDKYLGKAAKAIDSSKLNGAIDAAEPTVNTIAKRNSSGDLQARLLRATYPNQTTMNGAIAFRVNNTNDNYTRYCSNPSAIADWLKSPLDSRYLGKTTKAVDTAKLEGKSKAQVISEARAGLAQVNTSTSFKNATFDNGTSTTVNINADSAGLAALNVCSGTSDAQTTGRVYVGQSFRHGGGIEYNGDNNPVTTGAGADYVTLFRKSEGQLHWTARNLHSNNDWEFRGAVKSPNFIENGVSLNDKYHGKSTKLAEYESSLSRAIGQDFQIRSKRALVGAEQELVINYGTDWSKVVANGTWAFGSNIEVKGDLKMSGPDSYIWTPNTAAGYTGVYDAYNNHVALKYTNGQGFDYGSDITITKNNPWLTLDSASSGSDTNEQAAGISLGESGRTNSASLHLSYTGSGYSYIGMGNLGSDNVADNWAMQMHYQNHWVKFRSALLVGDGNTKLSKGGSHALRVSTNYGYTEIGPKNASFCHYATDRPSHHFNKPLKVQGEIYAGPNYDKTVVHDGNFEQKLSQSAGQVTSGDSQKFAGKTEQEWHDYIHDPVRAAVAATNPIAAAFI